MKLNQSELLNIFSRLTKVYSSYNGINQPIELWLDDLHHYIASNKKLIEEHSGENDMLVLKKMFSELLMRSSSGETGAKIKIALNKHLITKENLTEENYRKVLMDSGYRFKDSGVEMMGNVVSYFRDTLNWNWKSYFEKAKFEYKNNFKKDDLLRIRFIGYKVRDLALSGFNENYIANDIHVIRVASRLGLPIELDKKLLRLLNEDRGISKADYLKLHKVFLKISELTNYEYALSDIDRIFWHFGRTVCRKEPLCQRCPVNNYCKFWKEIQVDTETKKKKKIVYVDMDGVLVDFERDLREKGLTTKEEIDEYVDNTEGLFKRLKPIPGAIEAFKWLREHFEVYILTTAPWKNISALSDKRW